MGLKTVYKVCQYRNGQYVSRIVTGNAKCIYEIGKETKPTVGLLMCFNELSDAITFRNVTKNVNDPWNTVIFKCKARVTKREVPFYVCYEKSFPAIKKFWENSFKRMVNVFFAGKAPVGTIFCTMVKPIQKVG